MTSFPVLQKRRKKLIEELIVFSCDLDYHLVERIVVCAECLVMENENAVNEATFVSQMAQHFNLTNPYMINLTFNMLKQGPNSKSISMEKYCKLLCVFLTKNFDLMTDFVFRVYDIDTDGFISKVEIYAMLSTAIPQDEEDHDDMLKELIDIVLKVLDRDLNGTVDMEEFRALVKKDILYVELLGQCLPEPRYIEGFKDLLLTSPLTQLKDIFRSEYTLIMLGNLLPQKKVQPYYPFPLDF